MSEREISKIICRVISEYVVESNVNLTKYNIFSHFSFYDIDEKKLSEAYNKDYLNAIAILPKNHLLYESNVLFESSIKSQHIHRVIREMRIKYGFSNWQCRYEHRQHGIEFGIIIPMNDELRDAIVADMTEYGYYLGATTMCGKNIIDTENKWLALQFEPYEQPNVRNEISEYEYIYHITPKKNIDEIKEFGFIPHSNVGKFNYPSRTYFVYGNISKKLLGKVANMLHTEKSEFDDNLYCIFQIPVDKIPENVEIFYDGNFENGIFVEKNISADVIKDIFIFNTEKNEYVDEMRERVAKRNIFRKIMNFFKKH